MDKNFQAEASCAAKNLNHSGLCVVVMIASRKVDLRIMQKLAQEISNYPKRSPPEEFRGLEKSDLLTKRAR